MIPGEPQGTPSSMLVASAYPQVRETRASPLSVLFVAPPVTAQPSVVKELPMPHTLPHSSPASLRTLPLMSVFAKAAFTVRSEIWLPQINSCEP